MANITRIWILKKSYQKKDLTKIVGTRKENY